MATVSEMSTESRTVLYDVAWHTYIELREAPGNYHVRMTYDQETLEILSPAARHEESREGSVCLPNFPTAKAEELLQQIGEVDDTTFKRRFRRWVRSAFATGAGE